VIHQDGRYPLVTRLGSPLSTARSTFSSLRTRNFRIFASGQLVANTGGWVQRIAQDWLVLSLTGSATDVGITTALQFLPMVLFGLGGGWIADRFRKRRILLATQVAASAMSAALAVLTLTGVVAAWHVYLIAFCFGCVTAIDNPCRQSFVNDMVGPAQLRNAISINSSVFQLGALIGPAISGILIKSVGSGLAFAINAACYAGPAVAMLLIRESELRGPHRAAARGARLGDGLRHVARHPRMLWPIVLVGVFGMFTNNLPVTLAAYARYVFRSGPGGYGLLTSMLAIGSLAGALLSARRASTTVRGLLSVGGALALLYVIAAATPAQWAYCVVLAAVGGTTLLLFTSANSTVQLTATDTVRGRVMGVYLLVFIGSGALGGPLLGAIDQHLGPRYGMLLAGLVPGLATATMALGLTLTARRTRSPEILETADV
jgi:MFS family permease